MAAGRIPSLGLSIVLPIRRGNYQTTRHSCLGGMFTVGAVSFGNSPACSYTQGAGIEEARKVRRRRPDDDPL